MPDTKPRAPRQLALRFDYGRLDKEKQSYVKAAHRSRKRVEDGWRGMMAVPPGTLVERVLTSFQDNTNIPLEIPFTTLLHYISGYLVSRNVTLTIQNQTVKSDFWTIVLAESGAGKTWTKSQIGKALAGSVPELQGAASSAAAFVDELKATPQGLWVRDEFLQLLKQIEQPGGPMAELKDYLLRIYDNAPIERKTKQYELSVADPALSILAFNALATFVEGLDADALVDGFAQRFAYVLARKDPKRPFERYPIWNVDSGPWRDDWTALVKDIRPAYRASEGAEKAFHRTFTNLVKVDLDESFYRRVLWRAHKYALVYHIVRGHAADEMVTEEDYAWAARLVTLQLADASEVIQMCSGSDLGKLIEQTEKAAEKLMAAGKEVTPRTLLQRVKGLGNANTARFVFDMIDPRFRKHP